MNGYNDYNGYNAQQDNQGNPQHNQGGYYPSYNHNQGNYQGNWNYQYPNYNYQAGTNTGYTVHTAEVTHEVKPEKKKNGAIKFIAIMLACALMGFGGGIAAVSLYMPDAGKTVVYKSSGENDAATQSVSSGNTSVTDIAAKARESVVSITTENVQTDLFMPDQIRSGAGSGVIISEDGTIITNNHVVEGAQKVVVTLPDGTEHNATLVGRDSASDIAIIKIDVKGLKAATLGDSDKVQVGEFCIAIGNPMGTLSGTVTDGIISALNRAIMIDSYTMDLMQMSAAVSPGNSGGGLFNGNGELIGIVNAKSSGNGSEGLGFAIPVNNAMDIATQLIENGKVSRAGLNISAVTIANEAEAAQAGVDVPGVYIGAVTPGGAADKAGLQRGDRIVKADDKELVTSKDLTDILQSKKVGDKVNLVIERGMKTFDAEVALQELTEE